MTATIRRMITAFVLGTATLLFLPSILLTAHGRDARYIESVSWKKEHFTRVIAASRSELGLSGGKRKLQMKTVDDKSCAVGNLLAFDVDDGYAFDIDEPVDVTVTYAPELTTAPFAVAWDRNGGDGYGASTDLQPDPGASMRRVTLRLDRARFAGQGVLKTDLAVGARNQGVIALCDIEVA